MATQENRPMISEVSICNQALSWLGHTPINSLQDNSTAAQLCRDNYEFLRDAVLEERMWTFATARAVSESSTMDAWGSNYVHGLPVEWLAVYRVYSTADYALGWRLEEGKNIITSDKKIYMWGLKRITDTGKFSIMFSQALAARLAADMAITLTENRQLQADLWQLYQKKLTDAAARDGQQGSNDKIQKGRLTRTRGRSDSYVGGEI